MKQKVKQPAGFLILFLILVLAACDGKVGTQLNDQRIANQIISADVIQTFEQFEQVRVTHAEASLATLEKLRLATDRFLKTPDQINQQKIKQDWLAAHDAFLRANFYSLAEHSELAFQVDAWPIHEGFLDSIPNYPQSGIINDLTVSIDPDSLQIQHGITDSQEVCLGFHSLEYFLFNRQLEDFEFTNDESKDRRRQALSVITDLLMKDIELAFRNIRISSMDFLADLASDDYGSLEGLRRVIQTLHSRVQLLFAELNHFDDAGSGHSRFSRSSWGNLRNQIYVLNELSGQQSELRKLFEKLDQKKARDYDLTLNEVREILANDKPSADKFARIPLLFAALGHQLDDLQIVLKNSTRH